MVDEANQTIHIADDLVIALSDLTFRFSRSGGPGGQHVNRRETRVELRFDIAHSPSLSEPQRELLTRQLANQMDSEGILHVVANTYRSQLRNRQDAIERFTRLIQRGLHIPKRRRPTKPSRQSAEKRLSEKRRRSESKRLRKPGPPDDL